MRCDALEAPQRRALDSRRPQVVVKVDRSGLNDTLPAALRNHLASRSRAARETSHRASCGRDRPPTPTDPQRSLDLGALEQLVLWPKLFRRIVPYLAAGFPDFDAFDGWLRADPAMFRCRGRPLPWAPGSGSDGFAALGEQQPIGDAVAGEGGAQRVGSLGEVRPTFEVQRDRDARAEDDRCLGGSIG